MSDAPVPEPPPARTPPPDIDADLVCEQCGAVNEPGTLYCHNCGNNLRDQRHRRLAEAGAEAVMEGGGPSRSRLVLGALSVTGLLLVLLMAWNVNTIAERIVGGETRVDTQVYHRGPLAPQFAEMLAELRENPLSSAQVQQAHETPLPIQDFNGRFVVRADRGILQRPLGEGIARASDGRVLFLALLDSGAEVRGSASIEERGRLSSPSIVYTDGDRFIGGVGFAVPHPEGGYSGTGVSDFDAEPFAVRIYRAP